MKKGRRLYIAATVSYFVCAAVYSAYAGWCAVTFIREVAMHFPPQANGETISVPAGFFLFFATSFLYILPLAGMFTFTALSLPYYVGAAAHIRLLRSAAIPPSKPEGSTAAFVFDVVMGIVGGYRFVIGIARMALHGQDERFVSFMLFGVLPTVISVSNMIFHRLVRRRLRKEESSSARR